jgi:hypothetical protein
VSQGVLFVRLYCENENENMIQPGYLVMPAVLSFDIYVIHVSTRCSQRLYLLKILRDGGVPRAE